MAQDGFGRDIWTIPFDRITRFLHVRLPALSPHRALTNLAALLLRRNGLCDFDKLDQDFDSNLSPENLWWSSTIPPPGIHPHWRKRRSHPRHQPHDRL